jgi:hypothetical protein
MFVPMEMSMKAKSIALHGDLISVVIGALLATILAAIVLVIYRGFVGSARPFLNDLYGAIIAAISGALALGAASIFYGWGTTEGMGGFFNQILGITALVAIYLGGMVLARRTAGSLDVRSRASDFLPFGLAGLFGASGTLLSQLLFSFS